MKTSFKVFLSEKAMNMAVYKDTFKRLEDVAKIGFEFEMKISREQIGANIETDRLKRFDISDLDDLAEYFDIDRNTKRQISNAYDSWFEDQKESWVDDNYHRFEDETVEDDKERERDARLTAKSKYYEENDSDSGDYTMKDWYARAFNSDLKKLFDEFDISPQYGWENENGGEFRMSSYDDGNALKYAADIFSKEVGYTAVGDPSFGGYKNWGVVEDSSIAPNDDDYYGVELVSPPMKPSVALKKLEDVFGTMKDNLFETDSTCGLHVGISMPNMKDKIDPLKLMLFMGEDYILDVFERRGNHFTEPLFIDALERVRRVGRIENMPKRFIKELDLELKRAGKYKTANLGKLYSGGYVEFRVIGGQNYEYRYKEVVAAIGRFLTSIELAIDPEAERQEYMKKVGKLMNVLKKNMEATDHEIDDHTFNYSSTKILLPLKRLLVNNDLRALAAAKADRMVDVLAGKMSASAQDMYSFIKYAYIGANRAGIKPDVREVVYLKKLMKQLGISHQKIKDTFNSLSKIDAVTVDDWEDIEPLIKKDFKL